MAKANAEATAERVDHLQGMILAGEPNTACLQYARQAWGGAPECRAPSSSSGHGVRSMTTSKAQTSTGKRCWPGAFRPCWRPPARPRPNGTQERWWLPSASSTGCAGWGSTHQPGPESTDVRSEPLASRSAELRISKA